MNLVAGHDKTVYDWACKKFNRPLADYHSAFGLVKGDGPIIGAVVFADYSGTNIEISYCGERAMTPGVVRALMAYCFGHLKVERVTARTPRDNKPMARWLPMMGFRLEGCLRHYYGPHRKHDALIFGLLKQDGMRIARMK